MKKLSLLLFYLSLFTSPAFAGEIVVDNISRNYIEYIPKNLGENRPLLISCHGMNQDAAYQKGMLQIESIADTAKFVTVFPNGIDKSWDISGDRDIKYVLALIDEMATKYKIDRNRVYLSGFSMGGMFTYHAMNKIADKIAAFAPISGYPMWGGNFTSSRPVPIIHTHGTSDDVVNFSGVANILAGWVRRNGCPSKANVVKPYRASHITRHTWGPGDEGVEVVLMELANKGHWISNDIVMTGEEIWNFCKRYSLVMTTPVVHINTPQNGLTFITIGGESDIPPILIEATAEDPDGVVESVSFYDGKELLSVQDTPPYQYSIENLQKGDHHIRVVAVDDTGASGSSEIVISVLEPTGNYVFGAFDSDGCVPDGWVTYDGVEQRIGYSSGLSSGSRVLHFTGTQRDFDYGLYTRNVNGASMEGYARFADTKTMTSLMLYPGNYQLFHRIANWNQSSFAQIKIAIESTEGEQVFSESYTPTANIGNVASNDFSGTTTANFTFDVTKKGYYTITFYTDDFPWADLVIGRAAIRRKGELTSIDKTIDVESQQADYYNLNGQKLNGKPQASGLYILNGKKFMVK